MRVVALDADVIVFVSDVWQTTCTAIRAGDEGFVIDSPVYPEELRALPEVLGQAGFPVSGLLATHGHWDHLFGRLAFPDAALGCPESTAERMAAEPGDAQRELRDFDADHYVERDRPLSLGAVQSLPVPGKVELGQSRELELYEATGHGGDGAAYWVPWLGVLVCGDYLSPVEIPMLTLGRIDRRLPQDTPATRGAGRRRDLGDSRPWGPARRGTCDGDPRAGHGLPRATRERSGRRGAAGVADRRRAEANPRDEPGAALVVGRPWRTGDRLARLASTVTKQPRAAGCDPTAQRDQSIDRERGGAREQSAPLVQAPWEGQTPGVLWLTGLPGAGKSTIADRVDAELDRRGHHAYVLDGDNIRRGLNCDLGFTDSDRVENIRRVAEVARLMVDAGLIVIVAFISPFASGREMARSLVGEHPFYEVFVDAPLEVTEARDPKGLYRRARAGELPNFTGIDSPYEPPEAPDLHLDTVTLSPAGAAGQVIALLEREGFVGAP